ncbi:MAG: hypothetical protein N2652_02735 [Kiritimatiellae bacterium]|nr:hypothetical protein [Kiritimatiellia bacterium]
MYEPIECALAKDGLLDRISVSPDERLICFEYQSFSRGRSMAGRTLYIAEFDAPRRRVDHPKPFANEDGRPLWFAYPRWLPDQSAIVYHAGPFGRCQLYLYRLRYGSTERISEHATADYRYPHGEAAPC